MEVVASVQRMRIKRSAQESEEGSREILRTRAVSEKRRIAYIYIYTL